MSEVESKHFNHPTLITGGAGFLWSHMITPCLEKQVDVVVIDNSSNSDLMMKEFMEVFNPELHDTQFVIYQGNQSEADKILGSDYQLKKPFLKNNQGIFIFKKLDYAQ
jgi:nucleoside-diphosphate-sugar epimerase